MLNILIVDDHRIERETIEFLIKKHFENMATYLSSGGHDALETMKGQHIDILFADIKMPKMNGLELVRRALVINPALKIIIFSGYGEFEYAKTAIALGVKEYLLKPLVFKEFVGMMNRIISECNNDRNIAEFCRQKLILDLIHGKPARRETISKLRTYPPDLNAEEHELMLMVSDESFFDSYSDYTRNVLSRFLSGSFVFFSTNEFEALGIIEAGHSRKAAEGMLGAVVEDLKRDIYVAVSRPFRGYGVLKDVYRELQEILEFRFYAKRARTYFLQDQEEQVDNAMPMTTMLIKEIEAAVGVADWDRVKKQIDVFLEYYGEESFVPPTEIRAVCCVILECLFRDDVERKINANAKAQTAKGIGDLYVLIRQAVDERTGISREDGEAKTRRVIQNSVEFIKKNYRKNIGVSEVAEQVHLAPNYLSHLFKQETGINLSQFLISVRMAVAEELIRTSNLKIKDIADEVGYMDQSYFGHVFKSTFGTTPVRYRELTE